MALTYDQIEFIQNQLRTNEFASDDEIRDILQYEGLVPYFYLDEILQYRKIFLTNPLASLDYQQHRINIVF